MDIVLKPFRRADHPAISDLWVGTWRATMPHVDFEARRGWLFDRLVNLHAQGAKTVCAAERPSGDLLGFVTLDPKSGWLDQLAVAPRAYGSGAGRLLLDAAKGLSPRFIELDVNQDNPRALRFYLREGFRRGAEGVNLASGLKTWALEWRAEASYDASSA